MDVHTPSNRHLSRRDLLKWSGVGLAAVAAAPAVWSPARAQSPKRGGTLSLRLWDPPHWDPHLTISYKTHIAYSFTHSRLLKHKAGPADPARHLPDRRRPGRILDPAQRDHVRLQAPQGRALAEQAAGERARADGGRRRVLRSSASRRSRAMPTPTCCRRWTRSRRRTSTPSSSPSRSPTSGSSTCSPTPMPSPSSRRSAWRSSATSRSPRASSAAARGCSTATGPMSGYTFVRNPSYFVTGPALHRPDRGRRWTRTMPRAWPPSSRASTTSAGSTRASSTAWTGCRSRTPSSRSGRGSRRPSTRTPS